MIPELEGVRFSFCALCRSGLHDDCRCERCCREKRIDYDENRARRDAQIADRAYQNGLAMGRLMGSVSVGKVVERKAGEAER